MEYFAKSKEHFLQQTEREQINNSIKDLLMLLDDRFTEWEKEILIKTINTHATGVEHQKTLEEHEREIIHCAEKFFETYGDYFTRKEKCLILEACRVHDWGKTNLIFQMMVNPQLKETFCDLQKESQIPHGFLSALSISKNKFLKKFQNIGVVEEDFPAFITAVYYHHTRKDNYETETIKTYAAAYLKEPMQDYLNCSEWKFIASNRNYLLFRNDKAALNSGGTAEQWNKYMLIKGMLNKFDYTVSAGYELAEIHSDMSEKKLIRNIEAKLGNGKLRPVQKYMQNHQEHNLVIIAPTGSGKTEAALLWLNGEKGFYTLPLKVSSNAIYDRIKKSYSYEDVSILHSDSMAKYLQESVEAESDGHINYERAKLLSQPLTVCTVDQLFKFVYKALGTEIFAATLKYSKVVLDEIQAYSPEIIATLINGLKTIHEMGGHFAIITATFPPVLQYFMEQYGLIEKNQYLFRDFSKDSREMRHKIQIAREFDIDKMVAEGEVSKVLVICNTVTKAQELYEEISQKTDNVYLLHSRFIRQDREMLERRIMDFSQDSKLKGIWITTQIVEASLDIDFDLLYTEMCPADSLLQRIGRCNRKWRYTPEYANIIVVDNKNGVGEHSVYEPFFYDRSLEYLKKYENVLFSEELKIEYINNVFATDEIEDSAYFKKIKKYLAHFDAINPLDYNKQEADEAFRNIQSITVVPDSVYEEQYQVFEKSREVLAISHMNREVRSVLNNKLDSLTLCINIYGKKYPEGVDRDTIGNTSIHRCCLRYDFDRSKCRGQGLLLNKREDEDFII